MKKLVLVALFLAGCGSSAPAYYPHRHHTRHYYYQPRPIYVVQRTHHRVFVLHVTRTRRSHGRPSRMGR